MQEVRFILSVIALTLSTASSSNFCDNPVPNVECPEDFPDFGCDCNEFFECVGELSIFLPNYHLYVDKCADTVCPF